MAWLVTIGRNSHKYNFCRNKHVFITKDFCCCCDNSMLAATKLLSQQNYVCHDKCSVQQKFCRGKKNVCCDKSFVMTYFCHGKRCVLLWQIRVLLQPVTTKLLSRQNYFHSDNYLWQWFAAPTQFTVLIKKNAHLHADTLKKSTEEFHISVTF